MGRGIVVSLTVSMIFLSIISLKYLKASLYTSVLQRPLVFKAKTVGRTQHLHNAPPHYTLIARRIM